MPTSQSGIGPQSGPSGLDGLDEALDDRTGAGGLTQPTPPPKIEARGHKEAMEAIRVRVCMSRLPSQYQYQYHLQNKGRCRLTCC